MGLQEDFLKMLQEKQDFTATKIGSPLSKWDIGADDFFDIPQTPIVDRKEQNAIWDALGASAWAFANEALFGVPGAALKRYGGEGAQEF